MGWFLAASLTEHGDRNQGSHSDSGKDSKNRKLKVLTSSLTGKGVGLYMSILSVCLRVFVYLRISAQD